jgi:very-short-patch-repair endonuclease
MAWPAASLLVEIEGGTWIYGRHSRPSGYEADCEKYNLAAELGWFVLRFTNHMVEDDRAVLTIERFMASRQEALHGTGGDLPALPRQGPKA